MGACSSKPKTAEFEGSMNFYLQEEMAKTNLDDDQKSGCNAGLKSTDAEQKISSQCSLQNLRPKMENEHCRMRDVLLEAKKEGLAGSSLENNKKETCARAEGTRDAKHHFVAEGGSQVSEVGQNGKKTVVQELYEKPAFAQKEDVLGSLRNSVLLEEEVVVELPQKEAFRNAENGKFQRVENINEEKELFLFEGGGSRIDAEEGNPASGTAIKEPVLLASSLSNVDFRLKINPASNLTNCGIENAAACSASRAVNGTILLHNDKSRDLILEKPSEPKEVVYGTQQHDLEEALKEQSGPLSQDSEWTNLNFMATPSNGSLAVKENDVSYVIPPALIGLPEASALSNGSLLVVGIKVDEIACIDILPSVLKSAKKGAGTQVKEAHIATSICDDLPRQFPKFTDLHGKRSASADENLGIHDTEKPFIGFVNKVEDDLMARNSGKEADMIPMDGTQVGLKKGSKEPFLVADTNESREALDSQTLGLSKVRKEANRSVKGQEYSSKQERDLIFCPDQIKVFKVVDMSKEQVIDYERHSAASQPPQTFQELKTIYGKDIASDVDEVLEKLASEFERQESLSSFLR